MKHNSIALIIASSLVLSGCVININGAKAAAQTEQKNLQLDAKNLTWLDADVGAGQLSVKGVRGQTDVQVKADIYGYDGLDYTLTLEQHGDSAKLVASFDPSFGFHFNRSPYIDLVITVPQAMALDINDGSGAIAIHHVDADIKINDGSGNIKLLGGQTVNIHDGSGSISIEGVQQHITISDGSGNIKISGGKAIEVNDGSGGIDIRNTHGKLDINDGSGGIHLEHIGGDTEINDGSGSISAHHINGKVTIDDGSGNIEVKHTKGLNVINSGSGSLRFKYIDGSVTVDD